LSATNGRTYFVRLQKTIRGKNIMNRCIDEKCGSKRIASAKAKCSDSFWWKSNENSIEGYVETPEGELWFWRLC